MNETGTEFSAEDTVGVTSLHLMDTPEQSDVILTSRQENAVGSIDMQVTKTEAATQVTPDQSRHKMMTVAEKQSLEKIEQAAISGQVRGVQIVCHSRAVPQRRSTQGDPQSRMPYPGDGVR